MKGRRRKKGAAPGRKVTKAFARGFVAAALVAALQDRRETESDPPSARKILRHAVQGGTALAAATAAANALHRRDYGLALAAVAAGAGGLIAAEHLLTPCHQDKNEENGLGQEEA